MKKVFYNRYECHIDAEGGKLWIYDRKIRDSYSFEAAEDSREFAHEVGGWENLTRLLTKIADYFGYCDFEEEEV